MLERRRRSGQEAGAGTLPWTSRCRHLPLNWDSSLPRASLSVCKLCLPSHRPKYSGRRDSNSVRRDIDHHAVPIPGLRHLEATAIQATLAGRPVKILAVCLSLSRPLIKRDLSASLDGGIPVLMAGDLNAKHVDWNPRLTTTSSRIMLKYADRKSCLIYGPDSPTTIPYKPSAIPDVLDIF